MIGVCFGCFSCSHFSWSPLRFRVDSFQVRLCFLNPPPEFLELVFLFEFEQSILQMKQLEYVEPWLLTTLLTKVGLIQLGMNYT